MKHKIYMIPAGMGSIPKRLIPEGAQRIGAITEAALVGTVSSSCEVIRGLLANDETYFIDELPYQILHMIYPFLRDGKVTKKLAAGEVKYNVRARLIMCMQPVGLPEHYKDVFDVEQVSPFIDTTLRRVIGIDEFEQLTDVMRDDYEIRDSGDRTKFSSGAVRDLSSGKGRYDLLPWETIHHLAIHYEKGATKYGERNWEKGLPVKKYFDSAVRHLTQCFRKVQDGENHGISALWNMVCMYETLLRIQAGTLPEELDDRPGT